jgi:8-oxo-dGTP pyrophosphatase MutT (NUDIX family)
MPQVCIIYTMKIPEHAKLVFKGKIFDVYQWEQEMFDGTKEIFEAIKRPGTVQVIATQGVKVLLSHEEQPGKPRRITFLGGRMEKDEESLAAAKRELLEESGMESDDWDLYRDYESGGKIVWPFYVYIARNVQKVAEPHLDAGEKIDLKEVSFEEFIEIVTSEDYIDRQISQEIYRLKEDKAKLAAFRTRLFGINS